MFDTISRPTFGLPILSLLIVFGDWKIIIRNINTLLFAPSSGVLKQFHELLASGEPAIYAKVTMPAVFVGYPLAAVLGVSFGMITGEIFRTSPPVRLLPSDQ
jgi:NitT/TauT family transport system permease protein